jgi:predicted nucleic acid-binding protein
VEAVQNQLETETVLVPGHWALEVTNVLTLAERKGRIPPHDVTGHLTDLAEFEVEVDVLDRCEVFDAVFALCRRHRLTSYDAAYLELAMRTGLPLATLDRDLRAAAAAEGVELLGM